MSRMTMDDDELSFDCNSVAMSRVSQSARSMARSTVCFAPVSGAASFARPKGILKSQPPALGRSATSKKSPKEEFYFGGALGTYIIDRWMDTKAQKRISVEVHLKSTDNYDEVTHRVSTSQKEFILGSCLSQDSVQVDEMVKYLFPTVKKAMPFIDTMEKFLVFIRNHPRYAARTKSLLRLKPNPTDKSVPSELRIPLGVKADFALVSPIEDPIFFGAKNSVNKFGEVLLYYELKEQRKDSFQSPEHHAPTRMMDVIPEEVSIDSRNHTPFGNPSATPNCRANRWEEAISVMEVDSDEEGEWERELGRVEAAMYKGMENASRAGNIEVETVYTQETTSSRRPSPTKRARSSASVASFKSTKSTKSTKTAKSTKSTKTAATVETRASKKAAAAKAGPKTTGLDEEEEEDFSL